MKTFLLFHGFSKGEKNGIYKLTTILHGKDTNFVL
jgi:hypothetical protein